MIKKVKFLSAGMLLILLGLFLLHIKLNDSNRAYDSLPDYDYIGEIKELAKVGDYDAVVPMITGSCYLTGVGTYLIDPLDNLKYGFIVG